VRALGTYSKFFEQQDDKREDNHLETGGQMSLTGHPQSAAFLQPRKTPLHNPLFRNNREARHVTAFDHFDAGPEHLLDGPGKGLPSIASIHQHVLDVRQGGRVKPKGGQRPAWSDTFAGGTCSAWGKPCVSKARCRLIPETFLPVSYSYLARRIRVLHALCIHDTKARLRLTARSLADLATEFF